jgi:quercetin dioxygenase-like cupin family protein
VRPGDRGGCCHIACSCSVNGLQKRATKSSSIFGLRGKGVMKKTPSTHGTKMAFGPALGGAAWLLAMGLASSASTPQNATVTPLRAMGLSHDESRELSMITVEYPPGGTTPAHTHHAQALLYVLEGSIVMQVKGGAPVTLSQGQTWYEGPDDVHVVSRNASDSAPAKYVVFMVKDKGAPILTPVK